MIFQTVLESRCFPPPAPGEFPASQQQREVPRHDGGNHATGSRTIIASSWLLVVATSPTLCRSLRRTSEWRAPRREYHTQTVTNRFAGVESFQQCQLSAWASIKSASLFSTALRLAGKRVTSRRVQIRRVLRSPHGRIDALAAGNFRQRCLGDRINVSKVSFSAAAVYSPLINKRFQWRDLTLYPASKPDDENSLCSCFTSIRYM